MVWFQSEIKEKRLLPETLIQKEKGQVKESSPFALGLASKGGRRKAAPFPLDPTRIGKPRRRKKESTPSGAKKSFTPSGAQGTAASPPAVAGERSPPAEPLDGGAPTLWWTHASARGPAGGAVTTVLSALAEEECGSVERVRKKGREGSRRRGDDAVAGRRRLVKT